MKRILVTLSVAVELACGSVDDKQACSASTQCPVGQYCQVGGGESRCWPDAVAPSVSNVTASCTQPPCLRDGVVRVTATVADDNEVLDASVSLSLDPARAFPMSKAAGLWIADVPLRSLPFDAFAIDVTATVVARDGARNGSQPAVAAAVPVTRLKWQLAVDAGVVGLSLTPPAVTSDGTAVVGGSNGKLYFVAPDGTSAHPSLVVGAGQITAAPAVGQHAIWVGSEDGNLYGVQPDGSALLGSVGVNVGGPIKGSIAVSSVAAKDTAFATCKLANNTGTIGAASTTANQFNVASAPDGFSTGPIVALDERIHGATVNGTNDAVLRTFTLSEIPFLLTASWTAGVGKGSPAPLAIDSDGVVVAASDEATPEVKRTMPGTTPTTQGVGTLSAFARDSAVIVASGDVIIGDENGNTHRFGTGGPIWVPAPALGSPVHAPMALAGTTAPFIVPTNAGKVFALGDDGTTKWQATLPSATQLRAGNIFTPPSQPAGSTLSYAYFSSGNGRLFAVIVDGQLDASAPWPKAFHDPRNTNHAGPQP